MRILHLSHAGLPDERIERSAWSCSSAGHEVHFAGSKFHGLSLPSDPFLTKSELGFDLRSNLGEPFSTIRLVQRLKRIVAEVKPDSIHAHDIFAGRLAAEIKMPFVYDDHEYWSKEALAYAGPVDPIWTYKHILWKSWEGEVLKEATAVIAVSDATAAEHREKNKKVVVVPNFPRDVEARGIPEPAPSRSDLASVYVGNCTPPFARFRDTSGLTEVFEGGKIGSLRVIGDERLETSPHVASTGRKSHSDMMKEISKCDIGLIPWKKHWFHPYCNPNKAYEYAHAGCLVMVTSGLEQVRKTLSSWCLTFDNHEQLARTLSDLMARPDEVLEKRRGTQAFARDRLLWDKYDAVLAGLHSL